MSGSDAGDAEVIEMARRDGESEAAYNVIKIDEPIDGDWFAFEDVVEQLVSDLDRKEKPNEVAIRVLQTMKPTLTRSKGDESTGLDWTATNGDAGRPCS
jgi:hypothetical protein